MRTNRMILMLAVVVLSSVSLGAQNQRAVSLSGGARYEGEWPKGEGALYSHEDGLVLGTFVKGKPDGECVCYTPNGEVFWGEYRKGKATGHGYLFRDNGVVITGRYRAGRYHGLDTIYRADGSVYVGRFKNGKLKERVYENSVVPGEMIAKKPSYPRIDFRHRQEEFLKDMEIRWDNKTLGIRQPAGFVYPRFQGGSIEDFTYWVNSQVEYPSSTNLRGTSRTVLVEFTVLTDGSVTDVHAVFGSNKTLNEAAEKAVSKSPKWEPAEQDGEKMSVRMTIPVVFNME